ncbi:Toxin-antitoxin system antitoxin component, family [Pseudomonas savastanoi pv. glycinea]|uniref:type II RES/Xre toxin-antitoxin system antitoxin n=1 Tax=Pseudomonas quasicaspiana TaxID=2829821 RepID=UPI000F3EBDDE|nr:antitoxin Xre/MbcA/ParS toxin-binding domain-containing protein [Pseudomonas quasicaspiana]RMR02635.1 Toxin-antitoxin system antitoxin component, family [Pseudomonas savastanoi pv. glycinea]
MGKLDWVAGGNEGFLGVAYATSKTLENVILQKLPYGSILFAICLCVTEVTMTATAEALEGKAALPKTVKAKVGGAKVPVKPASKVITKRAAPIAKAKIKEREKTLSEVRYPLTDTVAACGVHQPMVSLLLPGTNTDDRMEVFKATKAGFTLSAVINLVESVDAFRRNNVLSKIVGLSDRTLARRMKNKGEALTPEQSARALYYAEALERAQEVFGTRQLAENWMTKPARGLDGESPIDLLSNPVGYELVTDFLHRIEYGIY